LIGHRSGRPNHVETDILDVAERHEALLDSKVPRIDDGTSLPLAQRDESPEGLTNSRGEEGSS
jgi:hypothetical protein